MGKASAVAAASVRTAAGSTGNRFRLAAAFYTGDRRRYGRAELSFLRWEIARGVLNPPDAREPGSRWWRAINDRLLHDKAEAALLEDGHPETPSSHSVRLWSEFICTPSPAAWYRAHNSSIIAGYLENEPLAQAELPAERFMMNVALVRVMYAHALVARSCLALGVFAPLGRVLGDPRRGTVGLFLDLRRGFPAGYPLRGLVVEDLLAAEGRLPRAFDFGIVVPRLTDLYEFAAASLGEPAITNLISDGVPCYAWPPRRSDWHGGPVHLMTRLTAYATRAR